MALPGIYPNDQYNTVIEAVASGANRVNKISGKTHLDSPTVNYCLKTLISLEIIEKEQAILDENNRKKVSMETITKLEERSCLLPGHWQQNFIFFSKSGFTDAAWKYAEKNGIMLITLEEMYHKN